MCRFFLRRTGKEHTTIRRPRVQAAKGTVRDTYGLPNSAHDKNSRMEIGKLGSFQTEFCDLSGETPHGGRSCSRRDGFCQPIPRSYPLFVLCQVHMPAVIGRKLPLVPASLVTRGWQPAGRRDTNSMILVPRELPEGG